MMRCKSLQIGQITALYWVAPVGAHRKALSLDAWTDTFLVGFALRYSGGATWGPSPSPERIQQW